MLSEASYVPNEPAIVRDGGTAAVQTIVMTLGLKNKQPLVVPPAALRRAGFKSGQELEIKAAGGVISIVPKLPDADQEYTPEQRRIVDAQLADGLADIKAGRVRGPFSGHEEFTASLHKEARKLGRKPKPKRSAG